MVGADGENLIVLFPGANRAVPMPTSRRRRGPAAPGDTFLTQSETNGQVEAAAAAAPFDPGAVRAMLLQADLLFLNEVEAEQLRDATWQGAGALGVADVVVMLGARGCLWPHEGREARFDAVRVTPVDTTGAGDTFTGIFTGFVLAGLDDGLAVPDAIALVSRAAALQVTRAGAADAIPTRAKPEAFCGWGVSLYR